jgi:outer membrane protein OmpA-like peptidoglycan-associated protein
VERADRHVRERRAAEHGLDRVQQRRDGAGDRDRHVRGRSEVGVRYDEHQRERAPADAAQRILSQAVETLRANPGLRIRIEGHTCNIGTAEYNLALGDRRARSVMQYLISNGIAADRLTTVSFGEENPKYDNSREETRRLNRRAAMTLQIVAGD